MLSFFGSRPLSATTLLLAFAFSAQAGTIFFTYDGSAAGSYEGGTATAVGTGSLSFGGSPSVLTYADVTGFNFDLTVTDGSDTSLYSFGKSDLSTSLYADIVSGAISHFTLYTDNESPNSGNYTYLTFAITQADNGFILAAGGASASGAGTGHVSGGHLLTDTFGSVDVELAETTGAPEPASFYLLLGGAAIFASSRFRAALSVPKKR
jgi:hypothetical protein